MAPGTELPGLVVLLVALGATWWHEWRDGGGDDGRGRGDLEAARDAYAAGEIPLAEFERRAELAVDEEAARIRDVVEGISGIGPDTSASLALRFDTLGEVRRADREELEAVHGVGPSTADALMERFG